MKKVSIETVVERVAQRRPYANHWGQRLLQQLTIPKLGISLHDEAFIIEGDRTSTTPQSGVGSIQEDGKADTLPLTRGV